MGRRHCMQGTWYIRCTARPICVRLSSGTFAHHTGEKRRMCHTYVVAEEVLTSGAQDLQSSCCLTLAKNGIPAMIRK